MAFHLGWWTSCSSLMFAVCWGIFTEKVWCTGIVGEPCRMSGIGMSLLFGYGVSRIGLLTLFFSYVDATPTELMMRNDDCAICREKMKTAKKLACGHLFHVYVCLFDMPNTSCLSNPYRHCLHSWIQHHVSKPTCPTCRRSLSPPATVGAQTWSSHIPTFTFSFRSFFLHYPSAITIASSSSLTHALRPSYTLSYNCLVLSFQINIVYFFFVSHLFKNVVLYK